MKLSDVALVKTNYQGAHFWLTRRGSVDICGKPTRTFNSEHIGIKVVKTDILLPDYLYYALVHIHQTGYWQGLTKGTLRLVHIRVSDVRNLKLVPE